MEWSKLVLEAFYAFVNFIINKKKQMDRIQKD